MTTPEFLTREQLYELVWREPMLKVAERFGVSSSYLARVCTDDQPARAVLARDAEGCHSSQCEIGEHMIRTEIIVMAEKAGFDTYLSETAGVEGYDCTDELESFADLAAAKEREACAQVCEEMFSFGALVVADAIRARGKP